MKKGYEIYNMRFGLECNFIEVNNCKITNRILNFYWASYESKHSKDETIVGIWKIKQEANDTTD